MGQHNQGFALVSMTNKDVYYVSIEVGKQIKQQLRKPGELFFIETVDVKSGAEVSIAVQHVSSVVVKEGAHHA